MRMSDWSSDVCSSDLNVTTVEVAQPQVEWLVKAHGVKKVGALFPNDETGQQIAKDLAAAYKRAGAELAATEFFERDRVDFVPLLTRMAARGIDAIELDGNSRSEENTSELQTLMRISYAILC